MSEFFYLIPALTILIGALTLMFMSMYEKFSVKTFIFVSSIFLLIALGFSLYNVNTATTGDPQSFLELYFRTGGSTNFGKYSNPNVDTLIDQYKNEYDTEKRYEIATKIQQILLDDNASLFLVTPMSNRVSKSTVSGMEVYPIDFYMLDNKVYIK